MAGCGGREGDGVGSAGARGKALQAKWVDMPLLLEANELLSKEWKDLFWDFIDHWKELNKASECLTASNRHGGLHTTYIRLPLFIYIFKFIQ
ncbi:hypothetical protein GUJ93_ZPchr0001g30540 [Zizania palustris]|uniref:UGGT thioredoxin-like domain-containing protein n=1 Tax=Zizania palustris TaxID=103762 RepID=A0A8J5RPP9_ZIZPA|nr:hypothetical protein GUJ93_ZPchr0001g30540 [Zizania palustris]